MSITFFVYIIQVYHIFLNISIFFFILHIAILKFINFNLLNIGVITKFNSLLFHINF